MRWRTPRNGQDKVIRRQGDKGLRPDAPQSEIRNPESEIAHLPDARKARQPVFLAPQLATLVKDVPAGGNWLHEVKFDGYRMLAVIAGGQVRLMTRREQDWTARFPVIARALLDLPIEQAILDGELVVLRPDGVSDFQAMQNALKGGPKTNLVYYLFDLPHCGGYDLTRTPLIERKRLLRELLQDQPPEGRIRFSDHIAGQGLTVLQHACRLGLEGIICKREDSPYESARTPAWLKVKCLRRQEFVIGGFTDPGGARKGFGALLLGYNDDLGRLRYCGKVGTGFDAQTLHQIYNQVAALETHRPPFFDPPRGAEARGAHWIKPKLVAEIAFTEWTEDSHLRHPSFQGLREDKVPSEVTREEPQSMPRANGRGRTRTDARSPAPRRARPTADEHLEIAGVAISNPQRVLYADQGLTKGELAEYYQGIAEWILPHVARRPLTLVRCPEGQGGQCFYQKHVGEHLPRALRGIPIMEKNEPEQYFVVDDLAGLIALVQMGVLEIHVWGSREKDVEKPDRLIIDLDPGPEVEWADVVEAAVVVRDHLQELELESFVKTSGGKGLHVVAPIVPRADWDQVKAFAKQVATDIARRDPSQYVAVMTKAKRTGRIFIDYLRNGRGATAVAAYSTRARPGAPVSAPLRWDELPRLTGANQFTLRNLPRRIKMLKKDPWEGFLELRQRIPT